MDPNLEIHREIVAKLKGDITLAAIVGDRVYDRVPENSIYPFVQIGLIEILDDSAECIDSFECYITIHCWSRAYGSIEAKRMCSAVRSALHEQNYTLVGFDVIECRHRDTQVLTDPDGETSHGICEFRALIDTI